MSDEAVPVPIPPDLLSLLDAAAGVEGVTREEFITQALRNTLQPPDVPRHGTPERRRMQAQSLKELRQSAGLSRIQAARQLGCTEMSLTMWEQGKTKPQDQWVGVLAKFFQVSEESIRKMLEKPEE